MDKPWRGTILGHSCQLWISCFFSDYHLFYADELPILKRQSIYVLSVAHFDLCCWMLGKRVAVVLFRLVPVSFLMTQIYSTIQFVAIRLVSSPDMFKEYGLLFRSKFQVHDFQSVMLHSYFDRVIKNNRLTMTASVLLLFTFACVRLRGTRVTSFRYWPFSVYATGGDRVSYESVTAEMLAFRTSNPSVSLVVNGDSVLLGSSPLLPLVGR